MAACPTCGAENPPEARFCSTCATRLAPAAAPRETRKTVTVLFADVAGSTALGERLDPESLRGLMSRYFGDMKAIIEGHGGNVEKFIGDAVMAVFGIPVLHEDDALRAVRAAADIRDRLAALNAELGASRGLAITFRTGLYTGEVVAGDPATGQTLVTGDTVNTAARLEQAAPPGEILIGAPTYHLVRDAVEVEAVEPIVAKGKAEPVPAYRLIAVRAGLAGHARRLDTPLVGRDAELALLRETFERTVRDRSPALVTVLGTAGVGKSRLIAEFLASIAAEATVLKGRCLPYGQGITYWPLREIIHAAAGITDADDAAAATSKLRGLLDGAPDADLIARRVGTAIGLEAEVVAQEELFWAIRKLLEHLAGQRPLVTVWEDIHWAEPTLLDLLEYVVDLGSDAPLILLCPARPELAETRPGWGANRTNAERLHLEPLGAEASERLLDAVRGASALPPAVRARIATAAEGNPLYLEEIVGMLIDAGHLVEVHATWQAAGDIEGLVVPPSVRALLSARIDALPPEERGVAERASVVGRVFEAAAVRELAPAENQAGVARSLLALVRKELVRPERSELSAGDAFKFRHLLIRDAAYEALPKADRAELHERFADWLERTAGDRLAEYEEIAGHHLEQAHHYRIELGETGEKVEALAERAAARLGAAGRRSRERGDSAGAVRLLAAAAALAIGNPISIAEWELEAGRALEDLGRYADARLRADQALMLADQSGNRRLASQARILRSQLDLATGGVPSAAALSTEILVAVEDAEASGDAMSIALARNAEGEIAFEAGRFEEAREKARDALALARAADARSLIPTLEYSALFGEYMGATPANEVAELADAALKGAGDHAIGRCRILRLKAHAAAILGRFDDAQRDIDEAIDTSLQLSLPYELSVAHHTKSLICEFAGQWAEAEDEARASIQVAEASDDPDGPLGAVPLGASVDPAWKAGRGKGRPRHQRVAGDAETTTLSGCPTCLDSCSPGRPRSS
jgi:predicted ATPase/class 3 adenylate cyclase